MSEDKFKNNQDRRERILTDLLTDADGNHYTPQDPKMLSAISKLMDSSDKVHMHNDRIKTDNENGQLNRQVALAIAKATQTQTLRTRNEGEAPSRSNGPAAIGSDRNMNIDPSTIEPVGGSIDIDKITRDGRVATKGRDSDSEDQD